MLCCRKFYRDWPIYLSAVFAYFSFFMAQVFRGVRLLPEGHPYLNVASVGAFSIIDVISAAGRNVVYRRENIDQIIMFYTILMGLFIFGLQAFTLLASLFSPQVMAFTFEEFFGTNNDVAFGTGFDESLDIAFILLDRVFGVPEIFNSCVDPLLVLTVTAPRRILITPQLLVMIRFTPPRSFHGPFMRPCMFCSNSTAMVCC